MYLIEKGYGKPFNVNDDEIEKHTGGLATRSEILSNLESVIIAKPILSDLEELKEGGIMRVSTLCRAKGNYTISH